MDSNTKKILENLARMADEARTILDAFSKQDNPTASLTVAPGSDYSVEGSSESASTPEGESNPPSEAPPTDQGFIACTVKPLPKRLLIAAAKAAIDLNPANAPFLQGPNAALGASRETLEPLHIALLTSKYLGKEQRVLSVSFMESTPSDLRDRIISHMNAWYTGGCGIQFKWTAGVGDVRISRGSGGYWSYLGSDIFQIPKNRQTMNLQSFTMQTPESEYKRVVRHETGHTLGSPHEHMRKELVERLDVNKTIQWFRQYQGWDQQTVQEQVLTPLDDRSLMSTPADQDSSMCYQLPGSITKDGKPINGGVDINQSDQAFMNKLYPRPTDTNDDWDWLV
jgi:Astacin (Peptidase family M12A)